MQQKEYATPTTWLDYARLLDLLRKEFPMPQHCACVAGQTAEKAADTLYSLDQRISVSLEAAIRHFSRNKDWPSLSEDEGACLCLRMNCAVEVFLFLSTLSLSPGLCPISPPPESAEEEDVYEWCLITLWNSFGRSQVLSISQSVPRLISDRRPDTET